MVRNCLMQFSNSKKKKKKKEIKFSICAPSLGQNTCFCILNTAVQLLINQLPGIRPLAVCSGLFDFSRLDKLSGSWVMLSVWGGHWTLLWGNGETAADPSKREREREKEIYRE